MVSKDRVPSASVIAPAVQTRVSSSWAGSGLRLTSLRTGGVLAMVRVAVSVLRGVKGSQK